MAKVSYIIPSRHELTEFAPGVTVLQKTVSDLLANSAGDIEIVVGFDGPPFQALPKDSRIRTIHRPQPSGLKSLINELAGQATGKYLFKLDSHCLVSEGIDEVLQQEMQDNWLVTPRFYILNEQTWTWQDDRFYDYFFLSCPFTDPKGFRFKAGGHWPQKTREKLDILIDETPQFHGSGWFVSRNFYLNKLGGFPDWDPLGHAQEPPNLGLKTWLGPWGGQVMVNKKCWYAHMHKGPQHDRGFKFSKSQNEHSYRITAEFWMGNKWTGRARDIDWFIDRFWPLPTWPENWRQLYAKSA